MYLYSTKDDQSKKEFILVTTSFHVMESTYCVHVFPSKMLFLSRNINLISNLILILVYIANCEFRVAFTCTCSCAILGEIPCMWYYLTINPPTATSVRISQNDDILAKIYLLHLKVKHCQTWVHLQVKMSWPFLTGKSIVLYCWGWSKWQ